MWLKSGFIQGLGGGWLERVGISGVAALELQMLGAHKSPERIALIRRVRKERRSLLTAYESFTLQSLAQAQQRRPGEMAEVGVYEGGSARLLCEVKGDKRLHLFDTFDGLPPATDVDGHIHREHQYACSLESVQAYLAPYSNLEFHQGCFPGTASALDGREFCFVHFDVDLYESTRDCLAAFYPRMAPGGIILSHDYSVLAGVKQAFDKFFADKPEGVIELPTTQCMVVKAP